MTLGEVRALLRNKWKEGCSCAACGQHVQIYSRPITSSMAIGLILLYKSLDHILEWIHAEDFFKKQNIPSSIRGDFSKLRFWGLIESHLHTDGYYRITEKGINFVIGLVKVEANVLLYNNTCYGFKGEYKSIQDCLKKKFDYELLMKGQL